MIQMDLKKFLTAIGMLLIFAVCAQAYAQVYKTVDENGNVVYTDQPPEDGSEPIKLKPLSVIEAPVYDADRYVADDAEHMTVSTVVLVSAGG